MYDTDQFESRLEWLAGFAEEYPNRMLVYVESTGEREALVKGLGPEVAVLFGGSAEARSEALAAVLADDGPRLLVGGQNLAVGFRVPEDTFIVFLDTPGNPLLTDQIHGRVDRGGYLADLVEDPPEVNP